MNPSLPPQISSERSPQRWSAERSIVPSKPSCSFEIKRPRSPAAVSLEPAAVALPQASTPPQHGRSAHYPAIQKLPPRNNPESPETRVLPQKAETFPAHPSPKQSSQQPTPAPSVQPSSPEEFPVIAMRSLPVPARPAAVTSAQVMPQAVPLPHPVSPYSNAHKATITVQPFSVQQDAFKEPSLPRLKQVQLNSHRHSHNPVFPLSLLQDIATIVEDWQAQLDGLHEQIQAIYLDGPIVDGWLEAEATLDGVIQGYRLCGLDDQGQMWARPCPPDQLPGVSTAIARYQHLRQILAQKQSLEVRFQQLGETLAMVRSSL